MAYDDFDDILKEARQFFTANNYVAAEPLLNQLILRSFKSAEVFHMLGVIFYDQGKFNKAVRSFKRSLEIDPSFTDSSVGLSIILNDIGRYDEGRKVFEDAKAILSKGQGEEDPYLNEKLSVRHDELGELYCKYQRYGEGLEQYIRARDLSNRKAELTMKIVNTLCELGEEDTGVKELIGLLSEHPNFVQARTRLGNIYFDRGEMTKAITEMEEVLRLDCDNEEAKSLIKKAENIEYTSYSLSSTMSEVESP